jgi:hypothetical protein
MPTQFQSIFEGLCRPFSGQEVKTRQAQGGRRLSYITARTAMNRLDEVLGPENWWDEYAETKDGILCRLTIRLPDGRTVTKCDAGGFAGMASEEDNEKSGYSDAFKRAAVKFGVGRHLYQDGIPSFASAAPDQGVTTNQNGSSPRPEAVEFKAWVEGIQHDTGLKIWPLVNAYIELNNLKGSDRKASNWTAERIKDCMNYISGRVSETSQARGGNGSENSEDDYNF